MLDGYENRWALITGASSGIGAEFARKLASRGMHVILTARRKDRMDELANELHMRHGTRTEILVHDLCDPSEVPRLVKEIENREISVELLVNSAGFSIVGDIASTNLKRVLELVQVNMGALTELTYSFLPGMLQRQHGGIINLASVTGFQPVAYMPAYAASKAYVLHFSEALWAEARGQGVTVMALCPGTTRTDFFSVAGVPEWLKKQRSQSPAQVVKAALKGLEKKRQYSVAGWRNYFLSLAVRLATRRTVVTESMRYFRPVPKTKDDEVETPKTTKQPH